jgi:hypothetical protein
MNCTLALLLSATVPGLPAPPPNLDFRSGRLTHWEGKGFYITPATGRGPSLACGVCSSDCGKSGRTGTLSRTFVIPPHAGAIRFTAAAVCFRDCEPGPDLDVTLEMTNHQLIPKQVRTAQGWLAAPALLPLSKGRPREYLWPVQDYAGQTVRLVIKDEDDRPGCHVFCSGFEIVPRDEYNGREFGDLMERLVRENRLPPAVRYDTKHFMAFSTADEGYTEHRLYNCETIYDLFFEHFRKRGFAVKEPAGKLMAAIFDSQTGFEAYLDGPMSNTVTGIYHPTSNRLVVYDFGTNRAFMAGKKNGEEQAKRISSDVHRKIVISMFSQRAREFRNDANIGTIMHEVAHQLSFNGGLLNRHGDVPLWLAEGLACYCEATDNGGWQGVGEPNPMRANWLAGPPSGRGSFIPLTELVSSDDWLRKSPNVQQVLLGYAQSWALFHMLIEERPKALRKYLALIYSRRTSDNRLADFVEVFGDLNKMEREYQAYMKGLADQQARIRR